MAKTAREEAQKNIAENRKAFHDYHILETYEAGVALLGTEVKSIREGNVNLRDSFARLESGEVWIYNVHINPYSHRGYADHEPTRKRKLLLRRAEIRKLIGKTVEKGMTLVPDPDVFPERPREGGDLAGQGQESARQARDDQAPRDRSRDPRGREGAAPLSPAGLRASRRFVSLIVLPMLFARCVGRRVPAVRRAHRPDRSLRRGPEDSPGRRVSSSRTHDLGGERHRAIAIAPVRPRAGCRGG